MPAKKEYKMNNVSIEGHFFAKDDFLEKKKDFFSKKWFSFKKGKTKATPQLTGSPSQPHVYALASNCSRKKEGVGGIDAKAALKSNLK